VNELTLKDFRAAVKQLRDAPQITEFKLPMRDDIQLTVSGVVWIPGVGMMHPESFRDMAGEEAYQELLKRPRIVTSYDLEDE
jgi:hypothetical protein